MKLAFLADKSAPFFTGGYERRIWRLARAASKSHEVQVFTSMGEMQRVIDGVAFARVAPLAFNETDSGSRSLVHSSLFALSQLCETVSRWDPDVLYIESIPYIHLPVLDRGLRKCSCRVILNVNEAWHTYANYGKLPKVLTRKAMAWCLTKGIGFSDVTLAVSSVTAQSLRTNFGATNVQVLENGVDIPTSVIQQNAASHYQYDFIMIGRLVAIKRNADFLRALHTLALDYGWKGRAAIVGDGPLLGRLRTEAQSLGLGSRVDFPGRVSEEKKYELLRKARVYVLCSEREGQSLSTLEAFSIGLPAIVAVPPSDEIFGVASMAKDRVNALYYPLGDVVSLTSAMSSIVSDPKLLQELSISARATSLGYGWDSIERRFEEIVRNLGAPN